jgi:hypothetical protein
MTFVLTVAILLLTARANAHELGATQVTIHFRADGSYEAAIAVDPDALLTRLEVASRREISSALLTPLERDQRIAAMAESFLDGIDWRFDGRRARPAFEYRAAPADAQQAPGIVRLLGRVPQAAKRWTFSYAFATGWYALRVETGGGPPQTVWLEGGKPGSSFAVEPDSAQPSASGLRRLLEGLLPVLLLGLALMARRR